MATKTTGWSCVHATSTSDNTDTSIKIKVTCYWQNDGWTYDINNVSAWVYCNGESKKVKDASSVNAPSNSGKYSMGSATFTISKTTSKQSIKCYAKITSNSSYVSGTKSSTSTTVSVAAKTSYTVSYNANGGSGAPGSQTKWYGTNLTLSSTKPTRTGYTFKGWGTSASDTSVNYAPGATYSSNAALSLYAIWQINTWTVSYNANGGSGAPGSQTKTYGQTLTLSSTRPTRTGYTFKGWATSSSGGVAYAAGGSYTANAGATLYAVWQINTWTVSYNANGGSGAPGSQTKTYGQTLYLSSTKPTRTNYNFKGWATSSGGSVAYSPGSSYTANAGATLYAVWELAYVKPRITNFKAFRCSSGGSADDTGTFIRVSFNWATDREVTALGIDYKLQTATEWTYIGITASGTSGSVEETIGDGNISIETSYACRGWVQDSGGGTNNSWVTIGSAKFPIDVKKGGTGVAIGKVAETDNLFDVALPYKMLNGTMMGISVFENKADFGAIHKIRTINGSDYRGIFGVGANNYIGTVALELQSSSGSILARADLLDGGVFRSNAFKFSVNGAAYGLRNADNELILADWANNNVVINATGGTLFLGYQNTTDINILSGKLTIDSAGKFYYNSNGLYAPNAAGIYLDQYGNIHNRRAGSQGGNWSLNSDSTILSADWYSGDVTFYYSILCNTLKSRAYGENAVYTNSTAAYFGPGGGASGVTAYLRGNTVRLYAHTSGAVYLGSSGSTAITSDENLKNIYEMDDKYLDFFDNLKPVTYKYKLNGHRYHLGFGARQVEDALKKAGLTTEQFAGVLKDKDVTIYADENGTDEDIHYDELYSLRYEEFIALNTLKIQKQSKEIKTLNTIVQNQNGVIESLKEEIEYLKSKLA